MISQKLINISIQTNFGSGLQFYWSKKNEKDICECITYTTKSLKNKVSYEDVFNLIDEEVIYDLFDLVFQNNNKYKTCSNNEINKHVEESIKEIESNMVYKNEGHFWIISPNHIDINIPNIVQFNNIKNLDNNKILIGFKNYNKYEGYYLIPYCLMIDNDVKALYGKTVDRYINIYKGLIIE
jgi:hypothetical protein